ncbi:MAG: LacI family DNA-binding transcriptional regulator, partial [Burkholderiales bacterium]|nr:LacI family DNA-binding transcriptional regulator [Opitutaceae bacterium]
ALRAGTKVAAATRAAVEAAARELGYKADPFMSVLVNYRRNVRAPQRSATIAYVTNYPVATPWRQWTVYRHFYQGAGARAAELGYGMEEFSLRDAGTTRRAGEIIRHRGYLGLVMAPSLVPTGYSRLDLSGLPVVALGHSLRAPRLHYAVGDLFRCATDVLHQLKRLGYRRPGLAAVYEQDARIEHRVSAAFLSWQSLFVAERERVPVCLAPEKGFEPEFVKWFRRRKPDVVVGLGIWPGLALEKAGVVFPDDAGFASVALNADDDARYSGMRMDHLGMGAAAVDLLHAQVLRGESGVPATPRGIHVEARWHAGGTTRRVR